MKTTPKMIFDPMNYKGYAPIPPDESVDPALQPSAQSASDKAGVLAEISKMRSQMEAGASANQGAPPRTGADDFEIERVRVENVHKGDPGLNSSEDEN